MLALPLPEVTARSLAGPSLAVAAVNTSAQTVVSGPSAAVAEFEERLRAEGMSFRRLATTHAFHSSAMEPVAAPLAAMLRSMPLAAPRVPLVSNLTGTWLTPQQATDPEYWVRHLCETVRFADGIATLAAGGDRALVEVGPGNALCAFALQCPGFGTSGTAVPSIRPHYDRQGDRAFVRSALARLWLGGVRIDWAKVRGGERRRRVRLPTYAFERRRFWSNARRDGAPIRGVGVATAGRPEDWLHVAVWKQTPPGGGREQRPGEHASADRDAVLLLDESDPLGGRLFAALEASGRRVVRVGRAVPESRAEFEKLFAELEEAGTLPGTVVHALGLSGTGSGGPESGAGERRAGEGDVAESGATAASLVALTQAWTNRSGSAPLRLSVLTRGVDEVFGEAVRGPASAEVAAVCDAIDAEYPAVKVRRIDLSCDAAGEPAGDATEAQLVREVLGRDREPAVAYRARRRWVRHLERVALASPEMPRRQDSVHLVLGGWCEPGISLIEHLAQSGSRVVVAGHIGEEDRCEVDACRRRLDSVRESGDLIIAGDGHVESAVRTALELGGRIDGVLVVDGSSGEEAFAPLATLAPGAVHAVVVEELAQLSRLARALEERPVGFVAIVSPRSIGGTRLGSTLRAARSRAHAAFAHERNRSGATRWLCATCEGVPFETSEEGSASRWTSWIAALEHALVLFRTVSGQCEALDEVIVSSRNPEHRAAAVVDEDSASAFPDGAELRHGFSRAYVAPRSALEARLAQLWQDLFGIEPIGVHDNFFELGGTSLLATELVEPLGRIAGVDVPVDAVLAAPSVAELAAVVEEASSKNQEAQAADVLAQLEELSDEEVARLLAERQLESGKGVSSARDADTALA
jgi:phthiocerol/phenolphthiocerol synthesis type-I polyketide synthase E